MKNWIGVTSDNGMKCFVCGSKDLRKIAEIKKKPDVETDYSIPAEKYFRTICQCENCLAYNNIHDLIIDEKKFYEGDYNKAIDPGRLKNRFDKIISIEFSKSDNKKRVSRILEFLEAQPNSEKKSVLDVGSGTCVFLYELKKQADFEGYCIDPDPNAVEHAIKYCGVKEAHCGDVFDFKPATDFSLITFNKVLEHTKEPVEILKKAKQFLSKGGFIYIELPEGDRIIGNRSVDVRAEFAVEHFTIFNNKSISVLAGMAKLSILKKGVITDPSGKYTIYAFLNKN